MTGRILVDDLPANIKLLEARRSAEYFDAVTAMSGQEALAICERAECDLVLLDVMMPDMVGRGMPPAQSHDGNPPYSSCDDYVARPARRSRAWPSGRSG
jgi:response regulator RpfG family c-di-GMP phosphodiesterase